MANIHVRGLDDQLIQRLKQIACQQNMSVNTLILNIIQQRLGGQPRLKAIIYHDLDKLAGTWASGEAKAFMKSISDFEEIDKDIWK